MRLFNTPPALPTRTSFDPRAKDFTSYHDSSGVSRHSATRETRPQPASQQMFDDDIPNVPTAHGYESDDSVVALEKVPSRYDVSCALPDDFAIDDWNNDKYSQVGSHLARLSDDSASVQWKSFDEFDERDPNNQCYDPLQFDRDGDDWEENYVPKDDDDDDGNRCTDSQITTARQMKSLFTEIPEKNDEEEEESEDLSSLGILMNAEANLEGPSNLKKSRTSTSLNPSIRKSNATRNGEKANKVKTSKGMLTNNVAATTSPKSLKESRSEVNKQNVPKKNILSSRPEKKSAVKEQKPLLSSPLKGIGKFRRRNQNYQEPQNSEPKRQEHKEDDHREAEDSQSFKKEVVAPSLQPVRSILKQSSFASRHDEVSVIDDDHHSQDIGKANQSEASGVFEFFSSLLGTNTDAEQINQDTKYEEENDLDKAYIKNSCGIFRLDGQDSQDFMLTSKSHGCKDPPGASCISIDQQNFTCKENEDEAIVTKAVTNEDKKSIEADDLVFKSRSPVSKSSKDKGEKTSKKGKSETSFDHESVKSQDKADSQGNEYNLWCLGNQDAQQKTLLSKGKDDKSSTNGDKGKSDDACEDQILIQCIRDNDCRTQADNEKNAPKSGKNIFACQETMDFMNDIMTAEEPKLDTTKEMAPSTVTARELSLDDRHQSRRRSNRTSSRDLEIPHEIPIKTISIPSSRLEYDSVGSESTDLFSRSQSKKSDLYVDTKLEDGMKEMQSELGGKKKSLFSRRKRANEPKSRGNR
jgi:hypothetical protein